MKMCHIVRWRWLFNEGAQPSRDPLATARLQRRAVNEGDARASAEKELLDEHRQGQPDGLIQLHEPVVRHRLREYVTAPPADVFEVFCHRSVSWYRVFILLIYNHKDTKYSWTGQFFSYIFHLILIVHLNYYNCTEHNCGFILVLSANIPVSSICQLLFSKSFIINVMFSSNSHYYYTSWNYILHIKSYRSS